MRWMEEESVCALSERWCFSPFGISRSPPHCGWIFQLSRILFGMASIQYSCSPRHKGLHLNFPHHRRSDHLRSKQTRVYCCLWICFFRNHLRFRLNIEGDCHNCYHHHHNRHHHNRRNLQSVGLHRFWVNLWLELNSKMQNLPVVVEPWHFLVFVIIWIV